MRPAALPLALALNNNITKRIPKWVRAASCHPIDSPQDTSPVDQLQLVMTAPSRSTTATPAEPVSASCAPAIRIVMRSHMPRKPTILCGVVLSGEELRQLATLRDAEATALRVRALRGQT